MLIASLVHGGDDSVPVVAVQIPRTAIEGEELLEGEVSEAPSEEADGEPRAKTGTKTAPARGSDSLKVAESAGVGLVAGLGNPDNVHARNRHSAGFWFLDALAAGTGPACVTMPAFAA